MVSKSLSTQGLNLFISEISKFKDFKSLDLIIYCASISVPRDEINLKIIRDDVNVASS